MDIDKIKNSIRNVPDFPKSGIQFKDITTLLQDQDAFKETIEAFYNAFKDEKIDVVVGIESRGFIFAGTIARDLSLPFVLARKPGKLPNETFKKSFDLEYGSTSIEIQKNTDINKNQRIIIVDDLIATGGTAIACAELFTENFDIQKSNILVLSVIDLPGLGGSKLIVEKGYQVKTIMEF